MGQFVSFFRCILRIQPNSYVSTWRREYEIHDRRRQLLLQGHALRSKKREGNLLTLDEKGVHRSHGKDNGSLQRWYGHQINHRNRSSNTSPSLLRQGMPCDNMRINPVIEIVPHQIKTVKCSMRKLNQVVSQRPMFSSKVSIFKWTQHYNTRGFSKFRLQNYENIFQ